MVLRKPDVYACVDPALRGRGSDATAIPNSSYQREPDRCVSACVLRVGRVAVTSVPQRVSRGAGVAKVDASVAVSSRPRHRRPARSRSPVPIPTRSPRSPVAYAEVVAEVIEEVEHGRRRTAVEVTVIDEADVPGAPVARRSLPTVSLARDRSGWGSARSCWSVRPRGRCARETVRMTTSEAERPRAPSTDSCRSPRAPIIGELCRAPTFIPPAKPLIGDEERAAVDRVLRSGMIAQGPEVAAFEEEFAEHFGLGRACVAVNSGTSGLHLGLLARGHRPRRRGHRPVVHLRRDRQLGGADRRDARLRRHRPDTLLPGPRQRRGRDHRRGPRAVMPVHLYGHPADMDRLDADR